MLGIIAINLIVAFFCYSKNDLTLLMKLDLLVFTVLCFAIRPLFKDSFMQWLFSYITVLNIAMSIIILSYSISRFMPYPIYANTFLRLVMFALIIFTIRRYVQVEHRKITTHWSIFFFVALSLFIAFVYYLTGGDDIIQTLNEHAIPLHLLVLIAFAVYTSLLYFAKTISSRYKLIDDNLQMNTNQELLNLSISSMEDRIDLLNELHAQSSISSHDRRHYNNTLLELLGNRKIEDAIEFLEKQSKMHSPKIKNYCENAVINAAVIYYASLAEEKGIVTEIDLDIPNTLRIDSIEFAIVVSNLFENAVQACETLNSERERKICFTVRDVGRLALEIKNPCDDATSLDEEGYPTTKEKGHGLGTKSVLAFVEKNGAEINYLIVDGVFRVRVLI